MIDAPDVSQPIDGPYGHVDPIQMPSADDVDTDKVRAALAVHVCTYLVTSPAWHIAWNQYAISVVSLRDHPGLPSPTRKFDGATHELLVLAVDPAPGEQTVETMTDHCRHGSLPFLQPVNVAEQFEATDEEMRAVAWLAARAVVYGQLPPEPPLGYESFRAQWLGSCTRTLAHLRGEAHAQ